MIQRYAKTGYLPVFSHLGRKAAFLLLFALTGCAGLTPPPSDAQRQSLAPTGNLRVGFFASSPTKSLVTELGMALAQRLGVKVELVELPSQAKLFEAIKTGKVDYSATTYSPARASQMDFTETVMHIELGYLVLAGSSVSTVADVDRPGIRIGVTQGSTTQTTLPKLLTHATVIPTRMTSAGQMLLAREFEVYATNKPILLNIATSTPSMRILEGNWGVEHWAVCIPKGRQIGLAYLQKFMESARDSGALKRAVIKAGLPGTVVP